jgi:hypothetical protein
MMTDKGMIRNERKIQGCIDNAREFRDIVREKGSFQQYIDSQEPRASFDNLMKLRKDLKRFAYISKITSLHFLMDIGMSVLKPDSSVRRIFCRLGLLGSEDDNEGQLLKAVEVGCSSSKRRVIQSGTLMPCLPLTGRLLRQGPAFSREYALRIALDATSVA